MLGIGAALGFVVILRQSDADISAWVVIILDQFLFNVIRVYCTYGMYL